MKRYFGYIRVSTPKQGQGVSLQEQRAAILAHAERHGLTIAHWFEEKETAAKEGRNMFARMLSDLEKGLAVGVVIHKIDRSARNLWDWANLGKLFDRGIDVQFAHDSIDLRSRGGRLSADIMAVVAADYVRNLRDEVKKGFYGRLKQGYYPLPAPLGYLDRGAGKAKELDAVAGPLITWAFERYSQGTISLKDLARELHGRGLRSRRSARISVNTLSGVLHNPFYIGLIRIERTSETFQGVHRPLVSARIFNRVQEILAGKAPHKALTQGFTFRRFARCGACGRHLVGEFKKQRYVYYRCYNPACHGSVLRECDIDAVLMQTTEQIHLSPEELQDLKDLAEEELTRTGEITKARENHAHMQIAKCEERLSRLTDALVDGLVDKTAYEQRRYALLAERRALQDEAENPNRAVPAAQRVLQYLELPDVVHVRYNAAETDEKREIAEAVAWNFEAHGKNAVIALKSPYREIVNWRKSLSVDRVVELQEPPRKALFEKLKEATENDGESSQSLRCSKGYESYSAFR